MTETASSEPTHANQATVDGENGRAHEQTSTPAPEKGGSVRDTVDSSSELSDANLSDLETELDAEQPNHAASTNDISHESDHNGDEPPAKRRKLRDTTPESSSRKPKPISPPWKKIEADGPTSFTEGGRRKSGRINTVPHDMPTGEKRATRNFAHRSSPPTKKHSPANDRATPITNGTGKAPAATKATLSNPGGRPKQQKPPQDDTKKASVKPTAAKSTARTYRRSDSLQSQDTPPKQKAVAVAVGTRRSTRHSRDDVGADDTASTPSSRPLPRIKLRVRAPPTEIPNVHRDRTTLPPKLAADLDEFFAQAADIPIEKGGLLAPDDPPPYTEQMAKEDARIILQIEKEAEPGGLLSEAVCSVFEPDAVEEPPRQWAHADHLAKQMSHFRKLMRTEQHRHRATAKKLAIACEVEWRRRNPQPKTEQEIEQEAIAESVAKLRQVIKAMVGTWDNVKTEVNRRRLVEWEAKEQRRVKAALNQAVNMSEMKLQARQTHLESEELMDDMDDEDDDLDEADASAVDSDSADDSGNDEDNMSTSGDEDEKSSMVSDEGLTQEQLREKYANLPQLDEAAGEGEQGPLGGDHEQDVGDTTDESIDMDDDLGSSDEADSDEDDGEEEAEQSEEGESGLLGLLYKSELKRLKQETQDPDDAAEPSADLADTDAIVEHDAATGIESTRDVAPSSEIAPEPRLWPPVEPERVPGSAADADLRESVDSQQQPGTRSSRGDPLSPQHAQTRGAGSGATGNVNGTSLTPKDEDVEQSVEDVPMDAPEIGLAVTEAPIRAGQASPDTDAVTNALTVSRSQSPPTSDTKPSEVDTASSVELRHAATSTSRSASPQPNVIKTDIPFLLRGTLREYQHYGLDWLAGLYANNTNGILADEMGLGKTIQTIALLAHLACHHEVWGPHLVIVPTSVMLNWEMEFKKWCPGFKILTYYGNQEERKRKRMGWNNDDVWNVCITSYQLVLQDQQVFRRRRWHYMILDEAHNIKNFRSQRWQILLGFNTRARLLLTGTPLQNNLTELWSLLYFLSPPDNGEGGFADLSEFHQWFSRPESQILENGREQLDEEARAIIAKLHKVLRPYLLRRLKADVEKQMPAKYEHVEFCRLSKRQRELYDGFLSRSDTRDTLASGNYMSIINCLMQLRKVCNHPDLFVDRPIMTSFRMQRSVPYEFECTESVVRKTLLYRHPMTKVDFGFLNMIPTQHEHLSLSTQDRINQLTTYRIFIGLRDEQHKRALNAHVPLDPSTVKSNLVNLESAARWGRYADIRHSSGRNLDERCASMEMTITKFSCVTPAVVTRDMNPLFLGKKGVQLFEDMNLVMSRPLRKSPFMPKEAPPDPWHEARIRSTIQFPDKRLLQYDCGKLQVLDKLLRKLQSGGHRALIFTQMTKMLDILEQFLNIHGHKYLRLDGATKVEQRQILTDRFNHDPRILCFILSSRSGGLGINLTGADTVVFYDQDWNPAMDKQCQDRCHRIGQTRDVHIYRLVTEHTIEANILRKASQKQMLDDVVIQEGAFTTDYFSRLSVRDVVGSNGEVHANENDVAANEAMDRVLGGGGHSNSTASASAGDDTAVGAAGSGALCNSRDDRLVGRRLEQAEDTEDVAAARNAEKEIQQDDADFLEQRAVGGGGATTTNTASGAGTPRDDGAMELMPPPPPPPGAKGVGEAGELNAFGAALRTVDDFMLRTMAAALEGTPLELPRDRMKSKKKGHKGKDTRKR
ncbi:hypothetical protein P8C59_006954 [Phyllachora maydis]|uniref:DNA helicase n=1 Tax=Phyllachora maydis TaxID=1825666 RepID=A0AAD9I996_9PEZI|nr:hypothetical protein P8C59_006954 [Phyllachora maydis]